MVVSHLPLKHDTISNSHTRLVAPPPDMMDLDIPLDEEVMDYEEEVQEDTVMNTPLLDATEPVQEVTEVLEAGENPDEDMAEEEEDDELIVEETETVDVDPAPVLSSSIVQAAEPAEATPVIPENVSLVEVDPATTVADPSLATAANIDGSAAAVATSDNIEEEIEYDDSEDKGAQVAGEDETHDETTQNPDQAQQVDDDSHDKDTYNEEPVATADDENDNEEYYDEELSPLAPILVHVPDLGTRALFTEVEEEDGAPAPQLPVYLSGRDELAEEGLNTLLAAIREELSNEGVVINGELVLVEKMMDLKMGEDDTNIQNITLLDLLALHEGCGLPTPVQLFVTEEPHRFITRFQAIQREVAAAEARESARNSAGPEDEAAPEEEGDYEYGEEDEYDDGEEEYHEGDEDVHEGEEDVHEGEEEYAEGEEDQHHEGEEADPQADGAEGEHVHAEGEEAEHPEYPEAVADGEGDDAVEEQDLAEAQPQDETPAVEPPLAAAVVEQSQPETQEPDAHQAEATVVDNKTATTTSEPEPEAADETGEYEEDTFGIDAIGEAALAASAVDPGADDSAEAHGEPENDPAAADATAEAEAEVEGDVEEGDEYGIDNIVQHALTASTDDVPAPADEPSAVATSTEEAEAVDGEDPSPESTIPDDEYAEEGYDGEGEIEGAPEVEYDDVEGEYDEEYDNGGEQVDGEEEYYDDGEYDEEGEYAEEEANDDTVDVTKEPPAAATEAPPRSPNKRSRELDETDEEGKGKVPRLEQ